MGFIEVLFDFVVIKCKNLAKMSFTISNKNTINNFFNTINYTYNTNRQINTNTPVEKVYNKRVE